MSVDDRNNVQNKHAVLPNNKHCAFLLKHFLLEFLWLCNKVTDRELWEKILYSVKFIVQCGIKLSFRKS